MKSCYHLILKCCWHTVPSGRWYSVPFMAVLTIRGHPSCMAYTQFCCSSLPKTSPHCCWGPLWWWRASAQETHWLPSCKTFKEPVYSDTVSRDCVNFISLKKWDDFLVPTESHKVPGENSTFSNCLQSQMFSMEPMLACVAKVGSSPQSPFSPSSLMISCIFLSK